MLKQHSDIILNNLSVLVDKTNLDSILPLLEQKGIFNNVMLARYLDPSHNEKRQKTDIYLSLVKRGPTAFQSLIDALTESGQHQLANLLSHGHLTRSSSLNSVGSSSTSSLNEVEMEAGAWSREVREEARSVDLTDDSPPGRHEGSAVPLNLPAYTGNLTEKIQSLGLEPTDVIDLRMDELAFQPVRVKMGHKWQTGPSGPGSYRVESSPRGLACVITNIDFTGGGWFRRNGAENDKVRVDQLLHQLDLQVSSHLNKTKQEMDNLILEFSTQEMLKKVDCVVVVIMSHGKEGDSEEDTEIVGVDGVGLKVRDIISRFYHDACPALLGKPKIFIFQSCRGILLDPGVRIGPHPEFRRTETDGIGRHRVRSISDVFIAYAVPPGRSANRDYFTGGWFIQAVINVFANFAHELDIEDMIKLVDKQVQMARVPGDENHQTIATKTLGWNKRFFFNPGLTKGAKNTNGTDEGMDVVDCKANKNHYQKLGNRRKRNNGSDDDEGCYSGVLNKCNTC